MAVGTGLEPPLPADCSSTKVAEAATGPGWSVDQGRERYSTQDVSTPEPVGMCQEESSSVAAA